MAQASSFFKSVVLGVIAGLALAVGLMAAIWLSADLPSALIKSPYCAAAGALASGMMVSRRLGPGSPGRRLAGATVGLGIGLSIPGLAWLAADWLGYGPSGFNAAPQAILSGACGYLGAVIQGRKSKFTSMAEAARQRRLGLRRDDDDY